LKKRTKKLLIFGSLRCKGFIKINKSFLLLLFKKEVLAVCLLCSACTLQQTPRRAPSPPSADRVIFVIGRGYHTDIGIRTADLPAPLAGLAPQYPGLQTMLIGFGDRTFVTTRQKSFGTWLLTLLPGNGAMMVTGLRVAPEAAFGAAHVVRLHVSAHAFAAIVGFVGESFVLDHGAPDKIGNGPYPGSAFYASSRIYDLMDTCNTWTAAALASGGLDEPTEFTLFANQTMGGARRLERQGY